MRITEPSIPPHTVTSKDGKASLHYWMSSMSRDDPGAMFILTVQWLTPPKSTSDISALKTVRRDLPIYDDGILRMQWTLWGGAYTKEERKKYDYKVWGETGYDPYNERPTRLVMNDEIGTRDVIENTEPTMDRFSLDDVEKLSIIFADLYFELCSSYKFNNDDPAADPKGRYPDQLFFRPKVLHKRNYKTFYARGGNK